MATTEKCIYCNRKVTDLDVPEVDDNEEWDRLALEHRKSCEWIATRAHRINVDTVARS